MYGTELTESPYLDADTSPGGAGLAGRELLDVTFPQLVARQARAHPERELVVDGATRLTYAGFESRMTEAARSLLALGVQRGDKVAVWAPNSADWLASAMGASAAGAVLMPMNSRFKGAEALDVVRRGRPRVLFTMRRFLGNDYPAMLREAAGTRELDLRVVALDGAAGDGDLSYEDFLALGAKVSADAAVALRESISPDSVSDIMLTSGTTGRAKGVLTSHRQNVLAFLRYAKHLNLRSGERINATLPFFHNFGLKAGFLVSALLGGTCVCNTTFDPALLARVIEAERITFLQGTPTLFTGLLASSARHEADLGSLRLCLVAGAMISRDLVEEMQAGLCRQVVTGYGLSELSGGIALTPQGADARRVAEWSGQLVEGVEVKTVDETGARTPPGESGEILARSECVMLGYMDDQDASADAVGKDGWLRTGDIGILDEANYIRITDRKKDMFIVGGFNAYPAEIERLLLEHPSVANVAVIGMPDDRLGEVGAAFVVPERAADPDPESIMLWAREHMANYKVPRLVEVVDELPVNASLKVLKHKLRAQLARRLDATRAPAHKDMDPPTEMSTR